MPAQGYEIAGCFTDDNGDEFAAGGKVDVYDLAFDQSLTTTFSLGTFVVDAFKVEPPATPPLGIPAACGACGAVDFCVVVAFNAVPAGTPTPQTICADGNKTVNDGGFDFGSRVAVLPPTADLSVTKTDGVKTFTAGATLDYVITVSNAGPDDATGVRVQDQPPPALINPTWSCNAGIGAVCPVSGNGAIDELVDIPAGSSVVFRLTASTAADFRGVILNKVEVLAPEGLVDPDVSNNDDLDRSASARLFGNGFEGTSLE